MEALGGVASAFAVVQIADRVLTLCGSYVIEVKEAQKEVKRIQDELFNLKIVLERIDKLTSSNSSSPNPTLHANPELYRIISSCKELLHDVETKLESGIRPATMRRFGKRALKWPFKSKDVTKILDSLDRNKTSLNLILNVEQSTKLAFNDQNRLIRELPYAKGAAFNSHIWEHQPRCLPETRVQMLQLIEDWNQDAKSPCIFWLKGMAGTGKSTIIRTVADRFATKYQLGASYFFCRGKGDLGTAKLIFTTIAAQLASWDNFVRSHIARAFTENPHVTQEGLRQQWKDLILKPLMEWDQSLSQPRNLSICIDALDECESATDLQILLQVLPQLQTFTWLKVKIFVTSRPETNLRYGFSEMSVGSHRDFVLHEIDAAVTNRDIYSFLLHEFNNIKAKREVRKDWPHDHDLEALVKQANKLFIYAATACRFIWTAKYTPPEKSLALLLNNPSKSAHRTSLDEIYVQVLDKSLMDGSDKTEIEERISTFQTIVGPIVVLFDSFSIDSLSRLLGVQSWIASAVLSDLRSVLDVPEHNDYSVRLLHPSFRDFLLDSSRCGLRYAIHETSMHDHLARLCLSLMSKHLKEDICELRVPGIMVNSVPSERIQRAFPSELRYACLYWIDHLQNGSQTDADAEQVYHFLGTHFLHWLEALVLLGKVHEGILAIICLEKQMSSQNLDLHTLAYDAMRFARHFRPYFEHAPLQIYCSALAFAPEKSRIKALFKSSIPNWFLKIPKVNDFWGPRMHSFGEGSLDCDCYDFSDATSQVVTYDKISNVVELWDSTTGTRLFSFRMDQSNDFSRSRNHDIKFSPDGRNLTLWAHQEDWSWPSFKFHHNDMIAVFDTGTARPLYYFDDMGFQSIGGSFTETGSRLSLVSPGYIVTTWDLEKCVLIKKLALLDIPLAPLEIFPTLLWRRRVAVVTNCDLMVLLLVDESGSIEYRKMCAYNLETGAQLWLLESSWNRDSYGFPLALQGDYLAYWRSHSALYVLRASSGRIVHSLNLDCPSDLLGTPCLSFDTQKLAFTTSELVLLWNLMSGEVVKVLQEGNSSAACIKLSQHIMFYGLNGHLSYIDLDAILEYHQTDNLGAGKASDDQYSYPRFISNGEFAARTDQSNSFGILDFKTGDVKQELKLVEEANAFIYKFAFSKDQSTLATVLLLPMSHKIEIWGVSLPGPVVRRNWKLVDGPNPPYFLAVSSNNLEVVSFHSSGLIRKYRFSANQSIGSCETTETTIEALEVPSSLISVSSDGRLLARCTLGVTGIDIFDTTTGAKLWTGNLAMTVDSVEFSVETTTILYVNGIPIDISNPEPIIIPNHLVKHRLRVLGSWICRGSDILVQLPSQLIPLVQGSDDYKGRLAIRAKNSILQFYEFDLDQIPSQIELTSASVEWERGRYQPSTQRSRIT